MSGFAPILLMVVIYLLIGSAASKSRKTAKKGPGAVKNSPAPEAPSAADQLLDSPEPTAGSALKPSVFVDYDPEISRHDDSVYAGSMNAVTGEGSDPCHDEQLSSMPSSGASQVPAASSPVPSLNLSWTGDEIVKGFIISEVLNRK